jgi:hypothetical protein
MRVMPSHHHLIRGLALAVAVAAAIVWTIPADACGGGEGGGRRNRDAQAGPGDESHHGPQGRRGRGERGDRRGGHRAGDDDGDGRRGRPHRRWRRGNTGPNVDIGAGIGGTYGVPGGRIGPPTQPCAESQHAHAELNRLRNLRTQIESGKRIYAPNFSDGSGEWHKVGKLRQQAEQDALLSGNPAKLAEFERTMVAMRAPSLQMVQNDIDYLESQIEAIDAACP